MAYGKRSRIKDGMENYNIMLAGEGGIGKTTLMSEVCEKKFGTDGYMILNVGDEDGIDCLEDVTYEDAPDYYTFKQICNDIINNKKTDYPNLKVIVIDTVDQLLNITEKYVISDWNRRHRNDTNFKEAKTINPVEGGFGSGMDLVFEEIYSYIRDLKKAGVRTWTVCHVKTRDKVDALSNDAYTILTSSMAQRYFEAFKEKMHILGLACIDRTIVEEDTNRKDIMKKNSKIKVKRIQDSKRKIKFRDDNYSVDSKSRFAGIIDEIPMDTDEFIRAVEDAIRKSKKNKSSFESKTEEKSKDNIHENENLIPDIDEEEAKENVEKDKNVIHNAEEKTKENIEEDEDTVFDDIDDDIDEEISYPEDIISEIRKYFKAANKEKRVEIKSKLINNKVDETDISVLKEIYDLFIRKSE